METHCNQIVKRQDKRNLESSKSKTTHHIQEIFNEIDNPFYKRKYRRKDGIVKLKEKQL